MIYPFQKFHSAAIETRLNDIYVSGIGQSPLFHYFPLFMSYRNTYYLLNSKFLFDLWHFISAVVK